MFPFPEFPAAAVDADPSVVFALDSSLHIIYCNPAWDRFASENGGRELQKPAPLGHSVLDFITGALRPFYECAYRRVLEGGAPWEHLYECSSASVYRAFALRVLPMKQSAGLLAINSLRVERAHDRPSFAGLDEVYRQSNGVIVMCSHCRRTRRRLGDREAWDWVSDYVARRPLQVSHGLCETCLEYYYPK